jgi:hypothetical protein
VYSAARAGRARPPKGPPKRRRVSNRVRVEVPVSNLEMIAEGLNHLPEYPRQLAGTQSIRLPGPVLPPLARMRFTGPAGSETWRAVEVFLRVLAPAWSHVVERRWSDGELAALGSVVPLEFGPQGARPVQRGTERRAVESTLGFLRGLLGSAITDRLKQCRQCQRWFAATGKKADFCGQPCKDRWWSRRSRRAAGHSQYRRQGASGRRTNTRRKTRGSRGDQVRA